MLKLHPEQLVSHINKGIFKRVYFLVGNDFLLSQESINIILQKAITKGFKDRYTFCIDGHTNWETIFSICQKRSLFSSGQILNILFPENSFGTSINSSLINKKLLILTNLLHEDLLLIIRSNTLIKLKKNAIWFNKLDNCSALVVCKTPENQNLLRWIVERAKENHLHFDETICQFLVDYYEGNLLALAQIIDQAALLWPKEKLSLLQIEQIANDVAQFTFTHWINALLEGKDNRASHILRQFQIEGREPAILLKILQREIFLLLMLKRESECISLHVLFDKYCILKNRRSLIEAALNRLSQNKLYTLIKFLVDIEIKLKQGYKQSIWLKLESFSLLICNKFLSEIFING